MRQGSFGDIQPRCFSSKDTSYVLQDNHMLYYDGLVCDKDHQSSNIKSAHRHIGIARSNVTFSILFSKSEPTTFLLDVLLCKNDNDVELG